MTENYLKMLKSFKELDIEQKKEEVMKNTLELLKMLYYVNKKISNYNDTLPVLSNYKNEDEYYDQLFSYIISLKEENAVLIQTINNM